LGREKEEGRQVHQKSKKEKKEKGVFRAISNSLGKGPKEVPKKRGVRISARWRRKKKRGRTALGRKGICTSREKRG